MSVQKIYAYRSDGHTAVSVLRWAKFHHFDYVRFVSEGNIIELIMFEYSRGEKYMCLFLPNRLRLLVLLQTH